MKTTATNCNYCNQLFLAPNKYMSRGGSKFCSLTCANRYNNIQRRKVRVSNCICAQCNKEFYKKPSNFRNSKSGLFFCCRECKNVAQKLDGIKDIMPSHYGNGTSQYRTIAMRMLPNRCNRCGYNSNTRALIVHHIDKNRNNNCISNLEVICANCHMIEHLSRE